MSIHQLRITTSMFWLFESVMSRRRLSAIFWAMQGTIPNFGRQSLTLVGRIFSLEIFHILWILLFYTPTMYAMFHWNAFDTFFEMEMSAAWQLVGKKSWLLIDWEEVYLQIYLKELILTNFSLWHFVYILLTFKYFVNKFKIKLK